MFDFGNAERNMLATKPQKNKYDEENYKPDITNKNDSHSIIASHVAEKSVCLDIGCAVGYIGEMLKQEKNCKVYGIEIDKEAIKVAKKKGCYKEIYSFSITDTKKSDYKKFFENTQKYDYIILGDVLEHLEYPGDVLAEFSKKLKPSGRFLISLPNIAHVDICKNLINRTFNYSNKGILDNTHLHFFTKKSFFDMIENVNEEHHLSLKVNMIGKTIVESGEILEKYPNVYKLLNKDKEASIVQYIYEVGKKVESIKEETSDKDKEKQRDYFLLLEKEAQDRVLYQQQLKLQRQENVNLLDQIRIEGEVNQNLTKELERIQEELESILQSRSWKVTKPLRTIMSWIRKD